MACSTYGHNKNILNLSFWSYTIAAFFKFCVDGQHDKTKLISLDITVESSAFVSHYLAFTIWSNTLLPRLLWRFDGLQKYFYGKKRREQFPSNFVRRTEDVLN